MAAGRENRTLEVAISPPDAWSFEITGILGEASFAS
jgi:hypothetical protein